MALSPSEPVFPSDSSPLEESPVKLGVMATFWLQIALVEPQWLKSSTVGYCSLSAS